MTFECASWLLRIKLSSSNTDVANGYNAACSASSCAVERVEDLADDGCVARLVELREERVDPFVVEQDEVDSVRHVSRLRPVR